MSDSFEFEGPLWLYAGAAAWHFITLPRAVSEQVRAEAAGRSAAWGSVKVTATIGRTRWKTSLFPDAKRGAYLLPVKAEVRKKEQLREGEVVGVWLELG